ncbi:PAS domain S-box-containing protein [Halarchaeum rubridurum]|uniref:PAS domain S-box-containing protein n=1 Tax=Halarchaeum rubridurum TaxID=489911 RepID=A0A830FKP6_9EURY|nr:PAS domain S-box protein [Halarchaeum rubridurum]MBP1954824.1 PAS domain S-box-containing protein [Halarchaeum rubridurum]GGM60013.1 hypothetical protein GCM10009017_07740 [Halarchaeum rubridurum]
MPVDAPRERLYRLFTGTDQDVETEIRRALEIGAAHLDLPVGYFARIDGDELEIVHAVGDTDVVRSGATLPLEEAYCRRTLDAEGALTVQDAAVTSTERPTVGASTFGTYIGVSVTVSDERYGTVCFADPEPRERAFTEADELFVELLGRLLGGELERRQQSGRLEREKRLFEGIAENSFDILFRVDADARFTYVSAAVERVLGYEPSELTGESFATVMTDESVEDALAAYGRLFAGEPVENLELEFIDADDDVVVIEVNATPIREGDEVVGAQGVGRDVTARKERERELRMKTRAIDGANVGISIADPNQPDTPLVYVNAGFEEITGYDESELLGRNCRLLQGERTDDDAVRRLREAITHEESVSLDLVNYRRNGMPFWNRVRLDPVFDDAGELTHYLGFQTDVTDRKRTEQLVRLLNRVLRHNLRNEMTVLLGQADLLTDADASERDALSERIRRISQELVGLSDHAAELERHASRERDPRRLAPDEVVADAVADHRGAYPDADVEVSVRTDRSFCAGPELRRAVSELVENALKHAGETPSVSVTVEDAGEWLELVVADDGPGIDEMEAEVIATGRETALEHASGLGLWVVDWIVTRYGGSFQIEARDAETGGTAALVHVPAIADDESVEAVARGPTILSF